MRKFISIIICIGVCFSAVSIGGCKNLSIGRSKYVIDCVLTDDMVLTGTEVVTFYNTTDAVLDELKFNLFGNAFRKGAKFSPISVQYQANAYPNGKNYGGMDILSVYNDKGKVAYSITGEDQNVLTVPLNGEVYPEETTEIVIEFSLKLSDVVARTGYNDATINLGNFYPILCVYEDGEFYECKYYSNGDPFYSECADYTVSITLDSDYVVAGSGKKQSKKILDENTKHTFSLSNARSFCLVASKNFLEKTLTHNGVMINYYYYADKVPDESIEYIKKSLDFFSQKFGAYPYADYSVVETKFVQGGMEYPTLVMISDELDSKSHGEVIVHETAHQWWQTAVGNNEIEHAFMDEGLAEYSVVLFYENYPEYDMTREFMIKSAEQTYKTFCTVYDKIFGSVDTSMLRSLDKYDSEYEYVNVCYIESCLMMEHLRTTIGDSRFFAGLKRYYQNYCYKIAKPDDLKGAFEKVGSDTNGFFKSFFEGKAIL